MACGIPYARAADAVLAGRRDEIAPTDPMVRSPEPRPQPIRNATRSTTSPFASRPISTSRPSRSSSARRTCGEASRYVDHLLPLGGLRARNERHHRLWRGNRPDDVKIRPADERRVVDARCGREASRPATPREAQRRPRRPERGRSSPPLRGATADTAAWEPPLRARTARRQHTGAREESTPRRENESAWVQPSSVRHHPPAFASTPRT